MIKGMVLRVLARNIPLLRDLKFRKERCRLLGHAIECGSDRSSKRLFAAFCPQCQSRQKRPKLQSFVLAPRGLRNIGLIKNF